MKSLPVMKKNHHGQMRKLKNWFLIKTVPLIHILEIKITLIFLKFQSPQAHLKNSIEESKQNYYSRLSNKLLDGKTSLKLYWSILKTFLNNKKLYFSFYTMENLSRTLRKRLNSLMTSLQGNVLLLITTVNLHRFIMKKHASYF